MTQEQPIELVDLDKELQKFIGSIICGKIENCLIQHWADGWLIHLYDIKGIHLGTIGDATLEGCKNKILKLECSKLKSQS